MRCSARHSLPQRQSVTRMTAHTLWPSSRQVIRSTELENPKVPRPEIGDQYRTGFGHDRGANEALPCRIQGSVQGAEVLAIGRNDGGLPAGHGLFGIAFAKNNPQAEIVALDWAPVLEVAKENARNAAVSDRYSTIEGSAFDVEYGSGYDLVLLTNFLHCFDMSTCEALLRKVGAALADGGRALTLEFVPNEDRISPPEAAGFSMTMLGATPSGDAYTFSELERMFSNAGFAHSEIHPLPPSIEQVVISHK